MNSSYIPLYRKYRPQSIEQIVGQEHIKRALANAIEMNRISHAYLFTGPRGTGKTSTARIFAKSLNCEKGPTVKPCNECENCKNITNTIPIDVIEIDAASNRSVNDADEIIQKVALAPVQSRYKIYIIDEVHMLTPQAFNALLKTLEEPPKNVIFILATTEVHKVLDTIKSRCQRFDFKRITTDDIANHLRYIGDSEKINITDDALMYIAQNSAGGMRDSIALLDQLSVLTSDSAAITVDDINRLLGRLSFNSLSSLFKAVAASNQNEALNILNDIYNQGNEPIQILSNFLEYLRNALIIKSVGSDVSNSVVQLNSEQTKVLQDNLNCIEIHQLVSLIDKCSNYIKELKLTRNPKLWLDVAVLDMANLTENTKLEDLQRRLSALESGGAVLVNSSPYNTPPAPVKKTEIMKPAKTELRGPEAIRPNVKLESETAKHDAVDEILTEPVPMSKAAPANTVKIHWAKLLENISSFPSRAILKQQAIPVKISEEEVIITIKNPNWLKQFGPDGAKHSFILEAANSIFGSPVKKVIVRAPEAGDEAIRKEQSNDSSSDDDKPAPAQKSDASENKEKTVQVEQKISQLNVGDVEDSNDEIDVVNDVMLEDETQDFQNHTTSKKPVSTGHSDGVNMVMDLFEGKFID